MCISLVFPLLVMFPYLEISDLHFSRTLLIDLLSESLHFHSIILLSWWVNAVWLGEDLEVTGLFLRCFIVLGIVGRTFKANIFFLICKSSSVTAHKIFSLSLKLQHFTKTVLGLYTFFFFFFWQSFLELSKSFQSPCLSF